MAGKIKKRGRALWIGYAVLVVLLALDFIIFYKFVFATGNVSLSIDLANNHNTGWRLFGFVISVVVLACLVYRYFLKKD